MVVLKKPSAKMRAQMKKRRVAKSGLKKVEKKQVKKIAENLIKKEHVLKYFNSSSTSGSAATVPAITSVGNNKEVSVVAFSSTTEFDNTGAAVKFGPQDYVPLHLARPFKENDADESLNAQALNGQYILPKRATTTFSLERVAFEIPWRAGGINTLDAAARSLPIYYRIIKVGIKAQQGNAIVVNPNLDIMVDSNGQPYGPDSDDFNRLNMRMSPINSKKYTKIMDLTGTIAQNNIITPNAHAFNSGTFQTTQITQKNGASLKHFTIPFMLSQRKNGKLFYDQPQQAGTGPATFTSGGKRELLLCFFTFENGHELLGGTDQPKAPDFNDIQIKFKSTSAFVDAQ